MGVSQSKSAERKLTRTEDVKKQKQPSKPKEQDASGSSPPSSEAVLPPPDSTSPPAPDSKEKPKPMIFAIMRNGHEVIRGSVIDVQNHLDREHLDDAIESYHRLHKWMEMHKLMEEGNRDNVTPKGFFSILDEQFDGLATKEGMRGDHDDLDDLEKAMDEAIEANDIDQIRKAFAAFKSENEAHLQKEEGIMMPKVMEMQKAKMNMKDMMVNELLATVVDLPEFMFFVQHANYILDKHDGGMPRARLFDHALWVCATPEQWKEWNGWIKGTLSEERYKAIMDEISF